MIRIGAALLISTSLVLTAFAGDEQSFGSTRRAAGTLIGILYDLKQTQRHEPVPDHAKNYSKTLDEFLVSGLDESLLNRYFRAPLPLYTTQLAIPRMNAQAAPRAFGVENEVEPRYWLIHYKGQVSPPEDGAYRFVGNFDDVLIVAINGRVVLDGCRPNTKLLLLGWKEPADKGPEVAANELARYGDWLDLKADQPIDIDIIIGERPGGMFHGVVLYEKKGGRRTLDKAGHAVLPLFQIAPKPMNNPGFSTDQPVWKCYD